MPIPTSSTPRNIRKELENSQTDISKPIRNIKPFHTEDQGFLNGRLLRPIAMERTSCHGGTYVPLQWDVRSAMVGRNSRT